MILHTDNYPFRTLIHFRSVPLYLVEFLYILIKQELQFPDDTSIKISYDFIGKINDNYIEPVCKMIFFFMYKFIYINFKCLMR